MSGTATSVTIASTATASFSGSDASALSGMSVMAGTLSNGQKFYAVSNTTGSTVASATINTTSMSDSLQNANWSIVADTNITDVVTGEGNDTVTMLGSSVVASVGGGDNVVSVTGSAKGVYAGSGNDTVYVQRLLTGSNTVYVGGGNDDVTVFAADENSHIDLGAGNDSLSLTNALAGTTIQGGDGDDTVIIDSADAVYIDLGDGDNSLSIAAATGDITIVGGEGKDYVTVSAGEVGHVSLGVDDDTLHIADLRDGGVIDMGAGDDSASITHMDGGWVSLGAGNDTLSIAAAVVGADGYASIDAGAGNDSMSLAGTYKYINLGDGTDRVEVQNLAANASVVGGEGSSSVVVSGTAANGAVFSLGSGNDSVWTDNLLNATLGGGNDTLRIMNFFEGGTIDMGAGDNSIAINRANSGTVTAGVGNDSLVLTNGALDKIDLGDGDNGLIAPTLKAGGNLTMGSGFDNVSLRRVEENSTISLGDGWDSLGVTDLVQEGTSIDLGKGDDTAVIALMESGSIALGEGADVLDVTFKAGSSDTVTAGIGDDSIAVRGTPAGASEYLQMDLGNGDDTFIGVNLNDTRLNLTAGSGVDIVSLNALGTGSNIDLGEGTNTLIASVYGGATEASIVGGSKDDLVSIYADEHFTSSSINLGDGNNSLGANTLNGASISSGTGRDTIRVTTTSDTSITAGDGANYISLNSGTDDVVTLGKGNDTVVVTAGLSDTKLSAGDGNDSVSLAGAQGTAVSLGAGKDTIYASNYDNASIASGAGEDVISLSAAASQGTATLTDFAFATDVLTMATPADAQFTSEGQVSLAGGSAAQMVSSTGYYWVTAGANLDSAINYVWAGQEGVNMNGLSQKVAMRMIGSSNDADGGIDTILGGTNKDTIIAGQGDYAWGGAGDDTISLQAADGVREYVGVQNGYGDDSVSGFATGFDKTSDAIYMVGNGLGAVTAVKTATTKGLVYETGTGSVALTDVTATDVELVFNAGGTDYTAAVVSGTYAVTDGTPDFFYAASNGTAPTLDFSATASDLVVDLGNTGAYEDNTTFIGSFSSVIGGADTTKLLGKGDVNEVLQATGGTTSLWGGNGTSSDKMVGASGSKTSFYYGDENGKDTIEAFNTGYADTSDRIVLAGSQLQSAEVGTKGLEISYGGNDNVLTVSNVTDANTVVQYSVDNVINHAAKIGVADAANSFTYDAAVDTYIGSNGKDTLTVGSDVATVELWLDNSHGQVTRSIDVVDASAVTGAVGIGGSGVVNESLVAGSGANNSLFGGTGADSDTLVGGKGQTNFYFGMNNGNDLIEASTADDRVMLYNVVQENVASVGLASDGTTGVVTLTDGSTLSITNFTSANTANTFVLGDGSVWTYNKSNGGWSVTNKQ